MLQVIKLLFRPVQSLGQKGVLFHKGGHLNGCSISINSCIKKLKRRVLCKPQNLLPLLEIAVAKTSYLVTVSELFVFVMDFLDEKQEIS
jgi:hypothetical protein